ncbi:MAG: MFS transporter [Oscillospiraceae bacterium]|jgi:fucose permease|nr:MFS transporter [Oscillospiraceae bacterium]
MKQRIHGHLLTLIVILFAVFLLYGMYFNLFGANAQPTMAFFSINKAELGVILSVQAIGCLVVSIFLALFGERFNKLRGLSLGLVLMGIFALLVSTIPSYTAPGGGYTLMLVFSLAAGSGYIIIDLLMNGVVADIYPGHKNTLLPFIHAMFGTGAMLAPGFVASLTDLGVPASFALPYRYLGLAAIIAALPLIAAAKRASAGTPYADMAVMRSRAKENPAEVFKSPKAWFFLICGIFMMIFQNGMSAWLPIYCAERLSFETQLAGLVLTVYFAGTLVMRLFSPLIFRFIAVARFYAITILGSAALFALCFLFVRTEALMIACAALGGLLQGTAAPSIIILSCDAFPERTASASAIFVLAVSVSSFIGPVLIGGVIETLGYQPALLIITLFLPISVAFAALGSRQGSPKGSA